MADNYSQVYTFIGYSVGIGVLLGLLYDVFRIIRMAFTVPGLVSDGYRGKDSRNRLVVNLAVFVCDILFFVAAAIISAIFIFYANNGRIRGLALLGSLVGFVAYYNSIGRLVTLVSGTLIRAVSHAVCFVIYRVFLPILKKTGRLFLAAVRFCFNCENRLYSARMTKKIIRSFKRKGC